MPYHRDMKVSLAQQAVESNEVYGRWRVEGRVENSTRKVKARCLDCTRVYVVDLYSLRRKDRANIRCQSCSNKLISASNKLAPGMALVRHRLHEYKKSARIRGYSWDISGEFFQDLIFGACHFCGTGPSTLVENSWDSIVVNGIDRLDNSIGYQAENVVTCCKDCNYAKRALTERQFIDLCERVTRHNDNRIDRAPTGGL